MTPDYLRGYRDAVEEASKLVRKYLLPNDQRAISWHEVADCNALPKTAPHS